MIPYGQQQISEEDIAAVVAVLRSDLITQGPVVPRFEQALCDYTGAAHGVVVNSGTAALHLAALALGLGSGDWLWTTPISFVASANCGLYCGAQVDFVDIDPESGNISVTALRQKLEMTPVESLPKVVVVVHLCGYSCDMVSIQELAEQYGFAVIEDGCHALGGRYRQQPIGSCRYSDITVFSFHPVKPITTAEGGVALTQRKDLAEQMRLLRSHGITRDPAQMSQNDGPWYYQQVALGFNYRMSELQAALGVSQLARLDEWWERRRQLARNYQQELQGMPLQLPPEAALESSAWHLYGVRLHPALDRKQVLLELRQRGIGAHVHYIPIHTQPWYRRQGFEPGDFPQAEKYYSEVITLPLYPGMSDQQQVEVIDALVEMLSSPPHHTQPLPEIEQTPERGGNVGPGGGS